jgi:hypothetical protein
MMRSWFDLRAVVLAALLAIAAALPRVTTSETLRDYYFFDVTLTSTSPGSTQFFWDLGKGFNEYDSSRQSIKIEPKPVVYRFMMPMGEFRALRFDPIDGAGVFTLAHAQVVDLKGRVAQRFAPEDFVPESGIIRATPRDGGVLEVVTDPATNDPVLGLRLAAPLVLKPGPRIWFEQGWPIALPIFLLGLLLSLKPVAARLSRFAAAVATRAQTRPALAIMVTAALTVAWACHPVLFQGRSFASPNNGGHMLYDGMPTVPGSDDPMSVATGSSDTGALLFQHLYYPMVQRDALAAGELPLWNRYSLAGEPLLGQGQSMFGDPFNFLTIAADGAAWAWDIRFLLARWLLAAALGGIVWQLGRHLGAAALTAIGAGFLGFFSYRVIHPATFSFCYAPLILLAWTTLHAADNPRRLALRALGLIAANWLVFTSGTVKEAYMQILAMNFAGALLLFARPETAGRRGLLLGTATAAGVAFVLLTAPGWVSFLSAWHHATTGYDIPQAQTLPGTRVLGLFDDIFHRQAHKTEDVVAPAMNFLFLAGIAWWLVQPAAWRTARATGLALLVAGVPAFALAFDVVPEAVIVKIPFVGNIVHVGNTFSCILIVLGAVLAGLGFGDAWRRLAEPAARGAAVRVILAVAVLAAVFFFATRAGPYSPFFKGYAAALFVAVALLPLGLWWGARPGGARGALWVALVLGLPLLFWRYGLYRTSTFDHYAFTPGPRVDLHAPSPAVGIVNAHRKDVGRANGWDSNLYASYNTLLRWEGVYGVDAVRSGHYHELAAVLRLERVWNWDWPNREAESRDLVRKYDFYNVTHWLATHRDGPHAIEGLELIAQADLDVYASPTAWPRAFFTNRIVSYVTPADLAKLIVEGDGRPFAALQQGEPVPAQVPGLPTGSELRAARDYRFTPNTTTFTVEATAPGVAVLAETYYLDDFAVTVNGQPADYFRINHTFKGVVLPAAGAYEISYRYWPEHFTAALWAAAAGLVLTAGGLIWLARRPALPASRSAAA